MSLSSPDKATRATKSEDATSSTGQPQHANSAKGPEINLTAMHGFKLYVNFIGICFGTFLMSLDIFVLATVLASPQPRASSPFAISDISWLGHSIHNVRLQGYVAAGLVSGRVFTHDVRIDSPLAGKLSSAFPLRWIYIIFFSIYMVGSLICGFAPNSNTFIVGRAVAGIGASASGGFVIVLTVSSRHDLANALSYSIASSLG